MERRALRRGPIVRVVIVMFVNIAVAGCGGGGSSGDGGGKELSEATPATSPASANSHALWSRR
jgi:hypothetical protein